MSRKRQEGILETLTKLPLWVSVIAVAIIYVFLRWMLPGLAGQSVLVKGIAHALSVNALLFACIFLIPAPIAYFNARRRRQLLDLQTGIESIRAMSWQEFELLVGEAFSRQGYSIEECGDNAPDGGVDLVLRKDRKTTLIQCKRWREIQVGVQPVRELFGVMHSVKADATIFVSSGRFTSDAVDFARGQPIRLIDGDGLADLVAAIQEERLIEGRLEDAIAPKSGAPQATQTCPACGSSMVCRVAKRGRNAGESFWGCSKYPGCKGTRPI
jgi:restriction system protein